MRRYSQDIGKVIDILSKEFKKYRMPVVDIIELQTKDPFKVLVTTILSARTKDNVTTEAARRLFSYVSSPDELEKLSISDLEKIIFPVGFYRTKAKNLKKLPSVLREKFNNIIPQTVEELIQLPGVGRKTANLVVAIAFRKAAVCVDTHVHRIFNRLGYVQTKTPFETEMELRKHLPKKYWLTFNSYFVSFGQNRCKPIKPDCKECPIKKYCDWQKRNE
ncbi:MAG: endonuclease III [Chitinispirillaceae bacterium]|nr:endonuclease III [Chitinispirillaceae bacterium]